MIGEALKQTKMLNLFNIYLNETDSWREARERFLKDFEDVLGEELGLTFHVVAFDEKSEETKKLLQKICDKL